MIVEGLPNVRVLGVELDRPGEDRLRGELSSTTIVFGLFVADTMIVFCGENDFLFVIPSTEIPVS